MKLDWMQEHRALIEGIIKFGNAYANGCNVQRDYGTSNELSALQIQVFEYILESEDKNEKMSEMANRLGVSKSMFSKNVKTLMEKGMLEKFRRVGNQKDIYVKPTQNGREIYLTYVNFIRAYFFDEMFRIADDMSKEEKERLCRLLNCFTDALIKYCVKASPAASKSEILVKME